MNLSYLPSTSERVAILNAVLFKEGLIGVSAISQESKASKGLVSRYLSLLKKHGMLERKGIKFLVKGSNKTRAVKLLLTISNLDGGLFRHDFVESAGLYGSCAKGENTEASDVDLWVRVRNASQDDLALLNRRIKEKFPNANVLVLTKDKIQKLKKEDPVFYHSLYFGSIIIYGKTGV